MTCERADQVAELEGEWDKVLREEDTWWRQRSKEVWARRGDRNTHYFHRQASAKRRKNAILGLYDRNDIWQDTFKDVESICRGFFNDLCSSSSPSDSAIEKVTRLVQPRLSSATRDSLDRSFSRVEIREALFQMQPNKSPGPDGHSPLFFSLNGMWWASQ